MRISDRRSRSGRSVRFASAPSSGRAVSLSSTLVDRPRLSSAQCRSSFLCRSSTHLACQPNIRLAGPQHRPHCRREIHTSRATLVSCQSSTRWQQMAVALLLRPRGALTRRRPRLRHAQLATGAYPVPAESHSGPSTSTGESYIVRTHAARGR